MSLLVAGLLLWFLGHGPKVFSPADRARIAAAIGEGATKALMALILLSAVALMVLGYQQAAYVELWTLPSWSLHFNNLLMVLALLVYISGAIPGHVRSWIRHPQLTGVKIWAAAHLLVNGDLASVVLFGGLLGWAVATMIAINKRDGKGPKPAPGGWVWDGVNLAAALALTAGIGYAHNWLGYWPFPGSPPA